MCPAVRPLLVDDKQLSFRTGTIGGKQPLDDGLGVTTRLE
jgi:hypothetical protein